MQRHGWHCAHAQPRSLEYKSFYFSSVFPIFHPHPSSSTNFIPARGEQFLFLLVPSFARIPPRFLATLLSCSFNDNHACLPRELITSDRAGSSRSLYTVYLCLCLLRYVRTWPRNVRNSNYDICVRINFWLVSLIASKTVVLFLISLISEK